jgi:DNA repair protein SbcD/Mre11
MVYRILHFSDLHLETSFASSGLRPEEGKVRRDDLRATLGTLFALARERHVDAVTIGGDLYDQEYALPDTADFLKQEFRRAGSLPIYIAPGRSDPYTDDSLYSIARWPENVHIFAPGRLADLPLAPDLTLWGIGLPTVAGSVLRSAPTLGGGVHLLLAHAIAIGEGVSSRPGQVMVTPQEVQDRGFVIALLGGEHQGRILSGVGRPVCAFGGSPELLSPEEASGEHNALLLTIEDATCAVERISVAQWRYQDLRVDLTGCEDEEDAVARLNAALGGKLNERGDRTIRTVTLCGQPAADLRLRGLADSGLVCFRIRVTPAHDLVRLADEQTVRGLLIRNFCDLEAASTGKAERVRLQEAVDLALQALDGKEVEYHETD